MVAAVLTLLSMGLVVGVGLGIASRLFYVWEDPKVLSIADELPGANCGGCGQAGCSAAAEAVAAGRAPVDLCVVGGFAVALAVGKIMGQKVERKEAQFSWTSCIYGVGEADPIYEYNGAMDCRAAVTLYGGSKLCPIGCIGLGTCVKACQFNALSMGDNNLPIVNHENCVGCGACVKECPKNIITLTSATQRIMSEYTTDECTAPCQRTCPTGINIRGYIQEIGNGNYERALLTIKEKCPLPLICGYICPAPCEFECRRKHVDEGVAINPLKRFVADYERSTHKHINPYKDPDNGLRIALIGGGAEGLTASYYLARLGYQPTLYEAKPELGGVLRYVIAEDRLPRDVLDHDIKGILEMGVEAKTSMLMGRDMTVSSLLREGFDAVVLTEGGLDSRKILHPEIKSYNASFRGLHIMLDFLAALSQGVEIDLGRHLVISSSGAKGLELARKCLELGAQKVTIVSDKSPDSLPVEFHDTKGLGASGIEIRPLTVVAAIGGISDRLDRLALEDIDPRLKIPQRSIIGVDTLIITTGRLPELVFVHANGKPENPTDEIQWQTIETFRTFPQKFGSDAFSSPEPGRISDSAAVVKSILSGRRLARAVHQHFDDELITPLENLTCEADYILDVTEVHDVSLAARQCPPVLDVEGDAEAAWIFPEALPGLEETSARREAERCLQCGLICYKKTGITESEESEREDA
jgi:formate dehydrogenase beta subunit